MVRIQFFLTAIATAFSHRAVVDSKSFTPTLKRSVAFSHAKSPHKTFRQHDVEHDRKFTQFRHHVDNDSAGRKSVICHAVLEPVVASTSVVRHILEYGATRFISNWKMYSLIPLIAGFVGWFTNYLAVQMIFFPIKWRGIPVYKVEGEPLGLFGWQGTDFCFLFYAREKTFAPA